MEKIITPANGPEVTTLPAPVAPTKKQLKKEHRAYMKGRTLDILGQLANQFHIIQQMCDSPTGFDPSVAAIAAEAGESLSMLYYNEINA